MAHSATSPSGHDEDDLVFLKDKGIPVRVAGEPKLSPSFEEYLKKLREEDVQSVMELLNKVPETLRAQRPDGSVCLITAQDLTEIQNEMERETAAWCEHGRVLLKSRPDSTMRLLSFHQNLLSRILYSKEACIKNYARSVTPEGSSSAFQEFVSVPSANKVARSLFWQTTITNDLYRQTLQTPFMVEFNKEKQATKNAGGS